MEAQLSACGFDAFGIGAVATDAAAHEQDEELGAPPQHRDRDKGRYYDKKKKAKRKRCACPLLQH